MDAAADPVSPTGRDWIPAQIRWTSAGGLVDWCHLGDVRFTAPFFEQTIAAAMAHPFNLLFGVTTTLDALALPASFELRPAGLIFHMSRCGSTLAAQMLASLPRNVVLSEPGPLDQILRAPAWLRGVSTDQIAAWLRATAAALGRRRHPQERDLVIKLEGWHALLLPFIRGAFPGVPWAFLYRQPVEVMASIDTLRPHQMLPGIIDPALVGLALSQAAAMSLNRYTAVVLQRICRAAVEHYGEGGGMLIEHRELPEAVPARLLSHFGLDCDDGELARMRDVARFDAKQPSLRYSDDSEAKRRAASPEMRELAETMLAPVYDRLEQLRAKQSTGA
jgi:hypothetical protein